MHSVWIVASNFGIQTISKCSCNQFVVVEQTGKVGLASFSDLQCHAHDQLFCVSGVVFGTFIT